MFVRLTRLSFAALLVAPLLAGTAAAEAQAQTYYKVVNRYSGMCLDVAHASPAHAANVVQGSCPGDGGYNQQWSREPTDGGYYRYRARHSGMCLDVAHASIAHGADVIQGACATPGFNQQWRFVATDGRYGKLRARHSEKCLDVANYNTQNGGEVLQATCASNTVGRGHNQEWRLVRVAP